MKTLKYAFFLFSFVLFAGMYTNSYAQSRPTEASKANNIEVTKAPKPMNEISINESYNNADRTLRRDIINSNRNNIGETNYPDIHNLETIVTKEKLNGGNPLLNYKSWIYYFLLNPEFN